MARLIALTRSVPPSITECELTHLERIPISFDRASEQHEEYERALQRLGCEIVHLQRTPDLPDSVFVEDTAVVVDEVAVITRPGAETRRNEIASTASTLLRYRPLRQIGGKATLDGGDVLRIGKKLWVGLSERSNEEGVQQLKRLLEPYKYKVHSATLHDCLHLKTAITEVAEGVVLLNPKWVDRAQFSEFEQIEVDPSEPFAGNALRCGARVMYPKAYPKTAERLAKRGLSLELVDASELAKAEGGLTCCSIIFSTEEEASSQTPAP